MHRRLLAPVLVSALVLGSAAGAAHAAVGHKKAKAENPCKLLTKAEIEAKPIVDITGVGAAAYLNDFNVTLTFAKNKKRAYSIQWADNDISTFGLATPQPIVDRLKALALEIVG